MEKNTIAASIATSGATSGPVRASADAYKPPHIVQIGEVKKLTNGDGQRYSENAGMSRGAGPDELGT